MICINRPNARTGHEIANHRERRDIMRRKAQCAEETCTECSTIVVRAYRELRSGGYGDRAAFDSALRVLKLRHPGHDEAYYRSRTAEWIAAAAER